MEEIRYKPTGTGYFDFDKLRNAKDKHKLIVNFQGPNRQRATKYCHLSPVQA